MYRVRWIFAKPPGRASGFRAIVEKGSGRWYAIPEQHPRMQLRNRGRSRQFPPFTTMKTYPPNVPIILTLQESSGAIIGDMKPISENHLTRRRGRQGREDARRWPMVSRYFRMWRSERHPSVLFISPREDARAGLDFLKATFRNAEVAARVYPPKVGPDTFGFIPRLTCRSVAAVLLGRWLRVLAYEEAVKRIGRTNLGGEPTLVCLGILVKDCNKTIAEILHELAAYRR